MRNALKRTAIVSALWLASGAAADAGVIAKVDLGSQEMQVYVDGKLRHSWQIATGRRGLETPTGSYRPQRLERDWHSRQYEDAPMPYSVFFRSGYAIHGGYSKLGRPASHGCIRLATGNAATLYKLISNHGSGSTRIQISG